MRWSLREVVAPVVEPVALEDAKIHLRVDGDEEDAWIRRAIVAAREYCEDFQGRAYTSRTLRLGLERWPSGRAIYLPKPPLQAVEAITYTLADGTQHTMDPSLYVVDADAEPGVIHLRPEAWWPSGPLQPGLPIRVAYTAGYGDADSVPMSVRQAILLLVGHWYEHREAVVVGSLSRQLEFAVATLLWPERVWYPGPDGGGS